MTVVFMCVPMTYGEYCNTPHLGEYDGFMIEQANGLRGWVALGYRARAQCPDCKI